MKGLGLGQPPGKLQMVWGCLALPGSGSGNARSGNVGYDPLGLWRELVVGLWISGVFKLMVLEEEGVEEAGALTSGPGSITVVFVSNTTQREHRPEIMQMPQICPIMKAAAQS